MSMAFTKYVFLVALIIFSMACNSTSSGVPLKEEVSIDSELIGSWLVKEVHINTLSSRSNPYQWNDPRLKWRLLEISSNKIESNFPENLPNCTSLKVEHIRLDSSSLLGKENVGGVANSLGAYGVEGDSQVDEAIRFRCGDGIWGEGIGTDTSIQGAWLIPLNSGEWGLRWYGDTILVIARAEALHASLPSFDCSMASNEAEKAICGSVELSGYDKSMAEAYGNASRFFNEMQNHEMLANLRFSQTQWIKIRNACGEDKRCLRFAMIERTEDLVRLTDGA